MYNRKMTTALIALLSTVLVFASAALAGPKITKIELGQPVNEGFYVMVPDTSTPWSMVDISTLKLEGIWINPDSTMGDENTTITGAAAPAGMLMPTGVSAAGMFDAGDKSIYPAVLISLPDKNASNPFSPEPGTIESEIKAIRDNLIENANDDVDDISANMNNIDLSRAIPAGTTVTFTVDMGGEALNILAIMGGEMSDQISYDPSGTGTLMFQTTTFGTTNAAGQELASIAGFLLLTGKQDPADSYRIIMQTDLWGGDATVFPLPDIVPNISTMIGITAYGPAGESRKVNVFFPDAAVNAIFGEGSGTDLAMFFDSEHQTSADVRYEFMRFGVSGTDISAEYAFPAPLTRSSRSDPPPSRDVTIRNLRADTDVCVQYDLDGDEKAGLAEVIHILKTLADAEASGQTR